jgi:plastocyanin
MRRQYVELASRVSLQEPGTTMTVRSIRSVAAVVMLLGVRAHFPVSAQVPSVDLFVDAPAVAAAADSAAAVVRERFVTVRFDRLDRSGALEPSLRTDRRLSLNLFGDEPLTAVLDRVSVESRDAWVWIGHLDGRANSTVTLAVRGDVMAGEVRTASALYEIRFAGQQTHVVRQVDPASFPPDLEPLEPAVDAAAVDRAAAQPSGDDGSRIDVLVVYTPAARVGAGGTAAIEALIDLAIANTNTSYTNSNVIQRVQLVNKSEIAYVEAGGTPADFNTDLNRLTGTADGFMDNVHALRNAFRADLVALVIDNVSSCGLAWLMNVNSAAFAPNGFSVSDFGCIAGNLTLAHEMGHNMSLNHDNVAPPGPFPFTYGRGYNNGSVRDVMAVSSVQPRLQNFSNPAVNFVGTMMVSGTADRNGKLALDNTRVAVSNFRLQATATVDFNADGFSDILWRQNTGTMAVWLMSGANGLGGGAAPVGTDYRIVGTADFNGDGKTDVLWRHNTTGAVVLWLMNGTAPSASGPVLTVDNSWQIVGTGDYNADGKADIVWRHSSGTVLIWYMNSTQIIGGGEAGTVDPSWQLVGTGDFNGDGKADILWRHSGGSVAIWLMNGIQALSGGVIATVDTNYKIVGTADYNADGRADILWRHTSGQAAIWFMNGMATIGGGGFTTIDPAWTIVGRGDYNGDGYADILWRHTTGTIAMWFMNGTTAIAGTVVANVDNSWTLVDGSQPPPPPPPDGAIKAVDFEFQNVADPDSNEVTISAGGTVTFSYPSGGNFHNVGFSTLAPTSCTQTVGPNSGPVPPLPNSPTGFGWAGTCQFNTPGTYTFVCGAHGFMQGQVIVQAPLAAATRASTPSRAED